MVLLDPTLREQSVLLTLDDYLKLPHKHIEVLDGRVKIVQGAGFLHAIISGNIARILGVYTQQHQTGVVLPDGATFLMFSPNKGLKDTFEPDAAYISAEDYVPMPDPSKPYPGVPTLAVEVASPGDDPDELMYKVSVYLEKGSREVWVVYPKTGWVYQYKREGQPAVQLYKGLEEGIDCEALFPGLTLTLAEIFKLPPWMQAQVGKTNP